MQQVHMFGIKLLAHVGLLRLLVRALKMRQIPVVQFIPLLSELPDLRIWVFDPILKVSESSTADPMSSRSLCGRGAAPDLASGVVSSAGRSIGLGPRGSGRCVGGETCGGAPATRGCAPVPPRHTRYSPLGNALCPRMRVGLIAYVAAVLSPVLTTETWRARKKAE